MLSESLAYLIRNIASFFILVLLLRFYLQLVHASFAHPVAQFTVKLTNFMVLRTRRIVPSVGGYDTATILLAWLCAIAMHFLLYLLSPWTSSLLNSFAILGLVRLGTVTVVELSVLLLFGAVIAQAVMSWVAPYNLVTPILDPLTRPFLQPIRRILPTIGGIDLSPWVLVLVLGLILRLLSPYDGSFAGI